MHFCRCGQSRTSSLGPCHHSMARPQVAGGGTASDMQGSCEYIEYAVADSGGEERRIQGFGGET